MKSKKLIYLFGFIVVLGALVGIFLTTFRSSIQYYVTVSELQAKEATYQNKTLKVAGRATSVSQKMGGKGSVYTFDVSEGGNKINVIYQGFVPDTFKENSEVVVTGHFNADDLFEADQILAKCASKYEAKLK